MALDASRPAAAPRLEALQALRCLAAVAVILHHSLTAFGPPLTGVMVFSAGVDIFFVISGVVIGYIDHNDGAVRFAAKRVIRVIPMYWLATLTYGVFRTCLLQDEPNWDRIWRSLLLIPNLSANWVPIYYPAWSLCFELGFYAIFGALLPFTRARTGISTLLVILFLCAVPLYVPFTGGRVLDTNLFIEFAGGLLLAELHRHHFRLPFVFALLSILLAGIGFVLRSGYPTDLRPLHWGIPAFLLVLGCLSLKETPLFRWRPLVFGGDASYALYLFHIPIMEGIVLGAFACGIDLHSRIRFILVREFLLVGSALAGGAAIHYFIERPLLNFLRRLLPGRPRPSVLA